MSAKARMLRSWTASSAAPSARITGSARDACSTARSQSPAWVARPLTCESSSARVHGPSRVVRELQRTTGRLDGADQVAGVLADLGGPLQGATGEPGVRVGAQPVQGLERGRAVAVHLEDQAGQDVGAAAVAGEAEVVQQRGARRPAVSR